MSSIILRRGFPDGSVSRVEFSPWLTCSYDRNETVREQGNRWYKKRTAASAVAEEKRAAPLAALHANTPVKTHFDSLGRSVMTATAMRRGV